MSYCIFIADYPFVVDGAGVAAIFLIDDGTHHAERLWQFHSFSDIPILRMTGHRSGKSELYPSIDRAVLSSFTLLGTVSEVRFVPLAGIETVYVHSNGVRA